MLGVAGCIKPLRDRGHEKQKQTALLLGRRYSGVNRTCVYTGVLCFILIFVQYIYSIARELVLFVLHFRLDLWSWLDQELWTGWAFHLT